MINFLKNRPSLMLGLLFVLALSIWIISQNSQKSPPNINIKAIELDAKLWSIYGDINAINRDIKDAFKSKKITQQEIKSLLEHHKKSLKILEKKLENLPKFENTPYSSQLKKLSLTADSALDLAQEAISKKRLSDIRKAKEIMDTLNELSREIPLNRTLYLLKSGCSIDNIYDIFRKDGIKDEDIQEYILEVQRLYPEIDE